jgi:hypothetical protein
MRFTQALSVFLTGALSLSSSLTSATATSTIQVNVRASKTLADKSSTAKATVLIEEDDLFNMPSFAFHEMGNDKDPAVYTKTKSTTHTKGDGSEIVVWEGAIMETGRLGFATLVQMENGDVAGTFSTESDTYSLTQTPDGSFQVQIRQWKDDMGSGTTEKGPTRPGSSVRTKAATAPLEAKMFVHQDTNGTTTSSGGNDTVLHGPSRNLRRNLQANNVIDVLVIITNRAMCEFAGRSYGCDLTVQNRAPIEARIPVIQSETNRAMQSVGVAAEIRVVDIIHLAPGYDGRPNRGTLNVIRHNSNVQQWRNEAKADLVAMITGEDPTGQFGGIAYRNSHESATSHKALQNFAWTHEIGRK